jgi:pimeloyl-ACP methyl ester carboxylesterase/1-acyl-sn-glycerol-3-phosphate acyltransferase
MAPFLNLLTTSLFAASSPATTSKRTVSDIVNDFKEIYRDLDGETDSTSTTIRRLEYSPTVRFTHVIPTNNGISSSIDVNAANTNTNQTQTQQTELLHRQTIIGQVAASHNYTKKVAVYLPGLDGTGISGVQQFADLANEFEFWRMSVDVNDRTSFVDLSTHVCTLIDDLVAQGDISSSREVVLIGESFGGLLAPSVAMRRSEQQGLKGLVLVNPATSFEESQWSTAAPFITSFAKSGGGGSADGNEDLPTAYSVAGGVALAVSIPDQTQFRQIVDMILSVNVENTQDLANTFKGMKESFDLLESRLPAKTLDHRIEQWCLVGCQVIKPRLSRIQQKTLVLAGKQDKMLPTKDEANVLTKAIPNATKVEFPNSGHFILDSRVNLTALILDADFFPVKDGKAYDPILDWKEPLPSIYNKKIDEQVKPLRTLAGPVFLSTKKDGTRVMGLGKVPSTIQTNGRPVLIVANHQLIGLDLSMIISELKEQRDIWARGLAHPIIFAGAQAAQNGGAQGGLGGGADVTEFEKYGAVQVSPRNYYRLMQTGQTAMLFPGGVREVFHGKDEAYTLFWPEGDRVDFVRTAARFNATIVTLSAIGAADSINSLIDAPDMLNLPFGLGERVANASKSIMPARFDTDNEGELFAAPLVAPGKPDRHYFMFGQPFDTSEVDPKNKEECRDLYQSVKLELERGFEDLLEAREQDPYRELFKRLSYELTYKKPAPTFPMEAFKK